MRVGAGCHLGYCSNIHAGESWADVEGALRVALPRVRHHLGVTGPFGIGLRLSARAAEELDTPLAMDRFLTFLRNGDYYVFTLNGFPYGAFHGTRVKERVYLPDWRDQARLVYTNQLASLMARLLADRPDIDGSVSTVPGAFRGTVNSDDDRRTIAAGFLRHAAYLAALREATGRMVTLAIEPEPACLFETADDAIAFFDRFVFDAGVVAAIARDTRTTLTVDDVRRHVGLCLDICHMAVEFEDPAAAWGRLDAAGIGVFKVQISSALRLRDADRASSRAALASFSEDTYLHQVVTRDSRGLTRYVDLPDALAAAEHRVIERGEEWRIHFHVPVFLPSLGVLETTQEHIARVLALVRERPRCHALEVETYTWDVLPPEHRSSDLPAAIARELAWVRAELTK